MPEKDKAPVQGDLLKALDDLTDLIAEQEQRGRVWRDGDEEDDLDFERLEFGSAEDDVPLLDDAVQSAHPALPSPAEIEAVVDQVVTRRVQALRDELAREIMIELRKRYPEL